LLTSINILFAMLCGRNVDALNKSVLLATGVVMPEAFHERRQRRPFRIIYITVDAFLQRFILRGEGAPIVPPSLEHRPIQAAAPSSEKTNQWKCGVARLDEQYEALFKVIRQFQGALKSGAEVGVMEEALASLGGHVEGHLALEEAYLEHIGFPGLPEHRQGHQTFQQQIHAYHCRIGDGDQGAGLELSQLLFAWMKVHVMKEDSVWSEFAKSRRRRGLASTG
jgi:hemerythrin